MSLRTRRMRGDTSGDAPCEATPTPADSFSGGRFWALSSESSGDEEEDTGGSSASSRRSLRYRYRTPWPSPSCDLCEKKWAKKEEKLRRQRWAARMMISSSFSPVSSPISSSLDSANRMFLKPSKADDLCKNPEFQSPLLSPTVQLCSEESDDHGWTLVQRRRSRGKAAGEVSPGSLGENFGSLDPNSNACMRVVPPMGRGRPALHDGPNTYLAGLFCYEKAAPFSIT